MPQKLKTIFRSVPPTPSDQTIHCSADDTTEENLKALPTFSQQNLTQSLRSYVVRDSVFKNKNFTQMTSYFLVTSFIPQRWLKPTAPTANYSNCVFKKRKRFQDANCFHKTSMFVYFAPCLCLFFRKLLRPVCCWRPLRCWARGQTNFYKNVEVTREGRDDKMNRKAFQRW